MRDSFEPHGLVSEAEQAELARINAIPPNQVQQMIVANRYEAFRRAAKQGHFAVLERLMTLAPGQTQQMIEAYDFPDFFNVDIESLLSLAEDILAVAADRAKEEAHKMIMNAANDHAAFWRTAYGHLDVMEHLVGIAPEYVQEMIAANNYAVFRSAASCGYLDVLERLVRLAPDRVQKMIESGPYTIESGHYAAFCNAAGGGHLQVMAFLMGLASDKAQEMIAADNYRAFLNAANLGHFQVMMHLVDIVPVQVQQDMIAAGDYRAFYMAAKYGDLAVMRRLMELAPGKIPEMMAAKDYLAFRCAASGGHLAVLKHLIELAPEQVLQMAAAKNYAAFRNAVRFGHCDVMEYLIALAPEETQRIIETDDYYPDFFCDAAHGGHWDVLEKILTLAPDKTQQMLATQHYRPFSRAAAGGHLVLLKHLIERASAPVEEMIAANDYAAFRDAAAGGHWDVLAFLIEHAPSQVQQMIKAMKYDAFCRAAEAGHIEVINRLIDLSELEPGQIQEMIAAGRYLAFQGAAKKCRFDVMTRLIALAPDKVQEMIGAYDVPASTSPSLSYDLVRHIAVIEHLVALAPDRVRQMIEENDYKAFRVAAEGGRLSTMMRIVALATPEQVPHMIAANHYRAFRDAASNGHLLVMMRLKALAAPDQVQQMIEINDYNAFGNACRWRRQNVIAYLLHFPSQFAYAELHAREYGGEHVQPYIQSTLANLRQRKAAFEQENPTGVFDVHAEPEGRLYYLMVRHLIRTHGNLEDMQWLLSIPAVKARVADESNALLRLALTLNNQAAASLLLVFPEVRALTEANNYYREERGGQFNLRQLAQDRESSMRALMPGEQAILARAIGHYQPRIEAQGGRAAVIDTLRTALAERFASSEPTLPLTWSEFMRLNLSPTERQRALETYYKNRYHTAWRYLQKPNPWMDEHASYVYVNPEARDERWSTFEEYLSEIALMYLGASDAAQPALDGFDRASRLENFISELALIARAHNWDRTRQVRDASNGRLLTEEYDDLTGDRPSCYSGVKRRLFQSVVGHPLFKLLRLDDIKQLLASHMREHFQRVIEQGPQEELAQAWAVILKLVDSPGQEREQQARDCLSLLNLPPEGQDAWLAEQQALHAVFFELNPSFAQYIRKRFELTDEFKTHAERFGGVTDLSSLLSIASSAEALPAPVLSPMQVKLQALGECGQALWDQINALGHIVRRSGLGDAKYQAVKAAVEEFPEELSTDDLIEHLSDEHSVLYAALAMKGPPGDKQWVNKLYETVASARPSRGYTI